jgi:hypothetical protein
LVTCRRYVPSLYPPQSRPQSSDLGHGPGSAHAREPREDGNTILSATALKRWFSRVPERFGTRLISRVRFAHPTHPSSCTEDTACAAKLWVLSLVQGPFLSKPMPPPQLHSLSTQADGSTVFSGAGGGGARALRSARRGHKAVEGLRASSRPLGGGEGLETTQVGQSERSDRHAA